MRRVKRWAWLVWWLNMADWAITSVGIHTGVLREANPLLQGWIQGPWGFLVKALWTGAALAILVRLDSKWTMPTLQFLAMVFTAIVIHNSILLAGGI